MGMLLAFVALMAATSVPAGAGQAGLQDSPAAARLAPPPQPGMVLVGPGIYRPIYPVNDEAKVQVQPAFWLDATPVTNGQYAAFVAKEPRWQRGKVPSLFADTGYLKHWPKATRSGGAAKPNQPITRVSWFAARAYCASKGLRLPSADEWDFAASASPTKADGRNDPAWRETILHWYSRPASGPLPPVGQTPANFWGVRDLHGVVWEWVRDFNSNLVSSDDRESGDKSMLRFCGAGALSAQDKTDYASLMRIAYRSSLRAHYTGAALGFRCAADAKIAAAGGKERTP